MFFEFRVLDATDKTCGSLDAFIAFIGMNLKLLFYDGSAKTKVVLEKLSSEYCLLFTLVGYFKLSLNFSSKNIVEVRKFIIS